MKILVTGGAGFIGSNIVKHLEAKGAKTFVLDNFAYGNYQNLLDVKAEIITGNICDEDILKKIPKIDAVIHLAAITDTTLDDDEKMMAVNYQGSKNILSFCLRKNIRLVYASSAGVYGEGKSPMYENQKITPHNIYAYSKYLFDCEVIKITKNKKIMPIIGLRYFNVYGPGEYHKGSAASMCYQLYLQITQNKRPRIFKHGEQKRDFIYVKDVARISALGLQSKKSAIVNVGTGKARSFNDIVNSLNKTLSTNLKPEYFSNPFEGKYQNFTEADTLLLQKTLKTKTEFSLEAGISDYVNNFLKKA